mmetsp:Transcript_44435/g.52050  ORF Transcript_44435/g.52050 Transcript_44435/m.52050 type:complete len:94 (-) Transcript_44435:765-1046(-)
MRRSLFCWHYQRFTICDKQRSETLYLDQNNITGEIKIPFRLFTDYTEMIGFLAISNAGLFGTIPITVKYMTKLRTHYVDNCTILEECLPNMDK